MVFNTHHIYWQWEVKVFALDDCAWYSKPGIESLEERQMSHVHYCPLLLLPLACCCLL